MKSWIRSLFTLLLGALLLGGALLPGPRSLAQATPALVYERFDTELTLNEAGGLHVRLVQQIRFDDSFSQAFFAIPKRYTTAIENIQLWEAATDLAASDVDTTELRPLTPDFVEETEAEIYLEWSYAPTVPGDVRLFVLEYDAIGTVWVYPDQSILDWMAVNADRGGLPVQASTVTLTLPPSVAVDADTIATNLAEATIIAAGNIVTLTTNAPLPDGTPFTVQAHLPPDAASFGVQDWQRDVDADNLEVVATAFTSTLNADTAGRLLVREETTLEVATGTLHQGFQRMRLHYVDAIEIQSVTLNGQPLTPSPGECAGCYRVTTLPTDPDWVYLDPSTDQLSIDENRFGEVTLDWFAPEPIMAGETVMLEIAYTVSGAWRVGPDDQFMTWQVVPDLGIPVERASMSLTLPDGVTAEDILLEGPDAQGSAQRQQDGSLQFTFDGPVVPNAWIIALTIPANATQATTPVWQSQFEAAQAAADAAAVARARWSLFQGVMVALAGAGALFVGVIWWLRTGQKRTRELLGGYISEPPAPLSPAIVAYLVDRKTSEQAILGTIFYMATIGLIEIDAANGIRLRRLRHEALGPTVSIKHAQGHSLPISRHMNILFDKVILRHVPEDAWLELDTLALPLRDSLPEIYAALGRDMQQYFIEIPGSRGNSVPSILWIGTYFVLLLLTFFGILPIWATFVLGTIAILGFVAWSALREGSVGGYADRAAQEADRWRKFKNYLLNIEKYGDQGEAQAILERYFGYVIAFGIQEVVLSQAARLGSVLPEWMPSDATTEQSHRADSESRSATSRPRYRWLPRPWPVLRSSPTPAPAAEPSRPTLASMSANLGSSLQRASQNLGAVLATASGDPNAAGRSVVLESRLRRRELNWDAETPVNRVLDDIMRQSVADAREVQAREVARRQQSRADSNSSSSGWSSSGNGGSSSSRSSGGFGRSSSSSSSSSRTSSSSSSSRSSSSSSRSGGGGRSGFR